MTRDEAAAAVEQHGSRRKAAAALHCSRHTIDAALAGKPDATQTPSPARPLGNVPVKSIRDFRQLYDQETIVPSRLDAALKTLGTGWVYEQELCKLANITSSQLSNFRDRYADFIVQVKEGRRVWVGRKQVAEELRRMV